MPASGHPASASITIRNLDPALKEGLRVRAAQHGHSMEAEARCIMETALAPQEVPPVRHLYDRVRARFAPLGGVDLELPLYKPVCGPPRKGRPVREGKKGVLGHFSSELSRALKIMAIEEDTTVQALMGEAFDLLMRARGRRPFGER